MWSTEVHECRLEQALQDSIALHRSRKYGTPPPRADAASLNAINVTGMTLFILQFVVSLDDAQT